MFHVCFFCRLPADFFDPGVSKFGEDSDSGDDVRGEKGSGDGGGSSVASQPTAGGIYFMHTMFCP